MRSRGLREGFGEQEHLYGGEVAHGGSQGEPKKSCTNTSKASHSVLAGCLEVAPDGAEGLSTGESPEAPAYLLVVAWPS